MGEPASTSEQGRPTPELIQLNQDFTLFAPHRLEQWQVEGGHKRIYTLSKSSIELSPAASMPNLQPIPLTFFTQQRGFGAYSNLFFTPFAPEKGLTVGKEEYSEDRLEKAYAQATQDWPAEFPLILRAENGRFEELAKRGLRTSKDFVAQFTPDMQAFVEGLRLFLFFPQFSFEGLPDGNALKEGALRFGRFYPLDFGPFKAIEHDVFPLREGAPIALPEDERLQQIRGRFRYLANKAEENAPPVR